MKPLLLLPCLLLYITTTAQKVEKYFDFRWKETTPDSARYAAMIERTDSGWHRKDYFIHERSLQMDGTYEDEACKTANGLFVYYHANRRLKRKGEYSHGQFNGLWVSYHANGMMSDSIHYNNGHRTGTCLGWYADGTASDSAVWNADGSGIAVAWFNNGSPSFAGRYSAGEKKNGKWQFFHNNGKVAAFEWYQDGVLVNKQYFDEQSNPMDTTSHDHEANFPGGIKAWQKYLYKHVYFPTQYQLVNADQAVVVVDADIDEDGNVSNAEVSAPFHPEFDIIALDAVRKSPKWLPAVQHNRRVRTRVRQPVYFAQE
ncbi:energy transducer TonB [Deminuibacter soli]|uniref:TonB C-terminal domain-containing protein n=1 Tax=Deminuibacter soli TaxID=2291815 RepID=A0A3E1NIL9_9BACT|nr:energy transducer TonB [Deminuibacter soli]RFM27779.1 hypothetical protein DXN05_13850 [Deminuibacter soli]